MYVIHPVPADVLTTARSAARSPLIERLTATGGEPLRCCLRDAEPGTPLILFNYEPPLPPSPYREVGAVYAHASSCQGPSSVRSYPPDWLGRPQVLRAYDRRGWIHEAVTHDGGDPDQLITRLLGDPAVERVHSRNIAHGCFMFAITRA